MYRSEQYSTWIDASYLIISAQMRGKEPIEGRFDLVIRAKKPDKRKRDLDNILKALSDILVKCGVIEDDHLCESIHICWTTSGDPCEVEIYPI